MRLWLFHQAGVLHALSADVPQLVKDDKVTSNCQRERPPGHIDETLSQVHWHVLAVHNTLAKVGSGTASNMSGTSNLTPLSFSWLDPMLTSEYPTNGWDDCSAFCLFLRLISHERHPESLHPVQPLWDDPIGMLLHHDPSRVKRDLGRSSFFHEQRASLLHYMIAMSVLASVGTVKVVRQNNRVV